MKKMEARAAKKDIADEHAAGEVDEEDLDEDSEDAESDAGDDDGKVQKKAMVSLFEYYYLLAFDWLF